jgi:anti-anti-sigma regulatory factor
VEICTQEYENCSGVTTTGRISLDESDEFNAELSELAESGKNIVLDFADVDYIHKLL